MAWVAKKSMHLSPRMNACLLVFLTASTVVASDDAHEPPPTAFDANTTDMPPTAIDGENATRTNATHTNGDTTSTLPLAGALGMIAFVVFFAVCIFRHSKVPVAGAADAQSIGSIGFPSIAATMALTDHWVRRSRLTECQRTLCAYASEHAACANMPALLDALLRRAYPHEADPRGVHDEMTGHHVYGALDKQAQFARKEGRGDAFAAAVHILGLHAAPDVVNALLSQVADRSMRCMSAQHHGVTAILVQATQVRDGAVSPHDQPLRRSGSASEEGEGEGADTVDAHHARLQAIWEDYIDDHKERAFASGFIEPCRYMYRAANNKHGEDHVNIHGLNWMIAMVNGGLGLELPQSLANDAQFMAFDNFWACLPDPVWDGAFALASNFGRSFEGVPELRGQNHKVILPGYRPPVPAGAFRDLVSTGQVGEMQDSIARMLGRFAHFFSRDFLVPKALEVLNAETKPEHRGFREAAAALFAEMQRRGLADAAYEDLDTFCYKDDMFMVLDVGNVELFFAFLGWVKAPAQVPAGFAPYGAGGGIHNDGDCDAGAATSDALGVAVTTHGECLICFEEGELVQLPHTEAQGDVSAHAMCRACFGVYDKAECPFCREAIMKEDFLRFVADFTAMVDDKARLQPDASVMAQLFEDLELFMMVNSSARGVIGRVAVMLVRDEKFAALLRRGVSARAAWLRDMAGVVFCLYGVVCASPHNDADGAAGALRAAVEAIVGPYERQEAETVKLDEHFHGALYNQALAALLSCQNAGFAGAGVGAAADICKRVSGALAAMRAASSARGRAWGRVNERVHVAYLRAAEHLDAGVDAYVGAFRPEM